MDNDRVIATSATTDVNTFTIFSNDNEVSRTYHVLSITVTNELNAIPGAQIIFLDGEAANETFPISDTEEFIPGKVIDIRAGYRGREELIFKGIVTRHRIKIRKNTSFLIVECRDEVLKMDMVDKRKYFTEQTDQDIIETLLENYNFEHEVAPTDISHQAVVQYNSTDWKFLLSRARVNGLFCTVENSKVTVQNPDTKQDAVVTIQYGATILELDAEIDARQQIAGMNTTAWNYANQEMSNAEAIEPNLSLNSNLNPTEVSGALHKDPVEAAHSGALSEPELDSWANAGLLWKRLSLVQGRVKCQGNTEVIPGRMIQLNGVGERFSGPAFVSGIRHQIADGNWVMDIQIGYPQDWLNLGSNECDSSSEGLLAGIHGLQIGIVTQLEGDPDGEDRILVKLPVINTNEDGIWARMASLDAGDSRGAIFRPEIDDEVIVGFLHNDPRHPVILGMCHSSAKPAPIPGSDDNHEKGFVSRSDMRLIFNDDEVSTKLTTQAGNELNLSEKEEGIQIKDQHGNKIVMNSSGILFESIQDVQMKASGKASLEAGNIEIKANMSFQAEGSGGCKFSAGQGITAVKGGMVQIN